MTQKKYISDIIGENYKSWIPGNRILIEAQTGTGKTVFVLTTLLNYCRDTNKTVLYVCNRTYLKKQIQNLASNNKDIMTTLNYQYLEHDIESLSMTDYSFLFKYDFIIFDEAHYFNSDSEISQYTDIVFNEIPNIKDSIIIFMTATPQILKLYLKQQNIQIDYFYDTDKDYSYIKNIIFYEDNNTVNTILETLPENDKAIYFCNNLERAEEYREHFNNSCFLCSENQGKHRKHISRDEKNRIINENHFESQILITTSALDNGISLSDENIKYIIIDIPHLITLIQCIGRKRIDDDSDKIILFVRKPSGNYINLILNEVKKKVDIIHAREYLPREEFERIYKKVDCHEMIDTDSSINYAAKARIEWDFAFFQSCSKDKNFYINTVKDYFQRGNTETEYYSTFVNKYDLEQYLNVKMDTDIKSKFKTFMKDNYLSTNKEKYRTDGFKVINKFFEDNQYNYFLSDTRDNSHRYWVLNKKC